MIVVGCADFENENCGIERLLHNFYFFFSIYIFRAFRPSAFSAVRVFGRPLFWPIYERHFFTFMIHGGIIRCTVRLP